MSQAQRTKGAKSNSNTCSHVVLPSTKDTDGSPRTYVGHGNPAPSCAVLQSPAVCKVLLHLTAVCRFNWNTKGRQREASSLCRNSQTGNKRSVRLSCTLGFLKSGRAPRDGMPKEFIPIDVPRTAPVSDTFPSSGANLDQRSGLLWMDRRASRSVFSALGASRHSARVASSPSGTSLWTVWSLWIALTVHSALTARRSAHGESASHWTLQKHPAGRKNAFARRAGSRGLCDERDADGDALTTVWPLR